jgi:hypothetical protein
MTVIGNNFGEVNLNAAAVAASQKIAFAGTAIATLPADTAPPRSAAITLAPSSNPITLTGSLAAAGYAGQYGRYNLPFAAAVIGPAASRFDIDNIGTLLSAGGTIETAGLLLGAAGTLTNQGNITGSYGVAMFGAAGTAEVANAGLINGTYRVGLYIQSAASVGNSGTIGADLAGLRIESAASVGNTGIISAAGYGVLLYAGGSVTNTGAIEGNFEGIDIRRGAGLNMIDNSGLIMAQEKPFVVPIYGTIFSAAIRAYGASDVSNGAKGTITDANGFGVQVIASFGNIGSVSLFAAELSNAGIVSALYGIGFAGVGTVKNSGSVLAKDVGVAIHGPQATLRNSGVIKATGTSFGPNTYTAVGVVLGRSDYLTNSASGKILAPHGNAVADTLAGYVYNHGKIEAGLNGVSLGGGGGVYNYSGTISGGANGVLIYGVGGLRAFNYGGTIEGGTAGINISGAGAALVSNKGRVSGQVGVFTGLIGYIGNSGTISATQNGVEMFAGGSIGNRGLIAGGVDGVYARIAAAEITNYYSGTISGGAAGIDLAAGGRVTNSGEIIGATGIIAGAGGTIDDNVLIEGTSGDAISFSTADASNLLIIYAASEIIGAVDGDRGVLEFAPEGLVIGTFTAAQLTRFGNFDSFQIDSGTVWEFTGNSSIAGTLVNDGIIIETGANTLTLEAPLEGDGTISLGTGPLSIGASAARAQRIAFTGTNETLALDAPAKFNATIKNFAPGDTIVLPGVPVAAITGENFAHGILTLSETTGAITLTFANPAGFKGETFSLFADATGTGAAGTGITLAAAMPAMVFLTPAAPAAHTETRTETRTAVLLSAYTAARHPAAAVPATPNSLTTQPGWLSHLFTAPSQALPIPATLTTL